MMIRVAPDEVLKALQDKNIEPIQGSMIVRYNTHSTGKDKYDRVCACGLTAILYDTEKHKRDLPDFYDLALNHFGELYSRGFMDGFDEEKRVEFNEIVYEAEEINEYNLGFADGQATINLLKQHYKTIEGEQFKEVDEQ